MFPTLEDVRGLAEWKPPFGVVSVYLRFDPGDRGGGWRTQLRNDLDRILEADGGLEHDARTALRATVSQVLDRFADREQRSLPRGEVGFAEVGADPEAQRWWSTRLFPQAAATAYHTERPVIAPLVGLASRAAARGVALLSAERVRLFQWAPGEMEEVESWEISLTSLDWRERKAQRTADPARAQGVSAAGRDQFGERLAENRHRFLGECHRLSLEIASQRSWPEIVAFGAVQHVGAFREGISSRPQVVVGGEVDLISTPPGQVEAIVSEAIARLDAERDRRLVERALEQAGGGVRGTASAEEIETALEEGRVDHLLLDGVADDGVESLVRGALTSSAKVTAVSGEAAALLEPVGGMAALLRY